MHVCNIWTKSVNPFCSYSDNEFCTRPWSDLDLGTMTFMTPICHLCVILYCILEFDQLLILIVTSFSYTSNVPALHNGLGLTPAAAVRLARRHALPINALGDDQPTLSALGLYYISLTIGLYVDVAGYAHFCSPHNLFPVSLLISVFHRHIRNKVVFFACGHFGDLINALYVILFCFTLKQVSKSFISTEYFNSVVARNRFAI